MTTNMRHTLMLNLDAAHAAQLNDLAKHFRLAAEDTIRLAIRLAHARIGKPDVLVPRFKPSAQGDCEYEDDDNAPS